MPPPPPGPEGRSDPSTCLYIEACTQPFLKVEDSNEFLAFGGEKKGPKWVQMDQKCLLILGLFCRFAFCGPWLTPGWGNFQQEPPKSSGGGKPATLFHQTLSWTPLGVVQKPPSPEGTVPFLPFSSQVPSGTVIGRPRTAFIHLESDTALSCRLRMLLRPGSALCHPDV